MWWVLAEISFSKWPVRPASSDCLFKSIFSDIRLTIFKVGECNFLGVASWGRLSVLISQNRGETTTRLERAAQIEPSQPCFGNAPAFEDQRLTVFPKTNLRKRRTWILSSLRSWRYCVGARLKFWRRSRVPKKGSNLTILQRLRRQISLDYYTISPATQARFYHIW